DWPGAALGYAFGPDAYDRLTAYADAHGLTVDQVPDAVAAGFADQTATYDYVKRVVSAGSAAAGQSTFEYETETAPDGYNLPRTKVIETQPGGAVRTTYLNFAGEVILGADSDPATGLTLATYRQYDDKGRLTLEAPPGAVAGYTDTLDAGLVVTLNPAAGRIETTSYYASTSPTISETVAGGVAGRQYQTFIQRGSGGTPILQSTTDYFSRTAGTITVYPVAHETRYRNADGTGGQTTSYAYTYFTGAIQPQQVTTTLPAVTTAQNGSGAADSSTVVYDDRGRVIWARDAAGYLTYTAYDDVTGGVTKVIEDVDT
ncbi:MAG: hypothetical protein J2P46_00900, partial [Zavarzinella sp.]|nr:hypothetical protein [Zavarzinella sp.]